jgi:hypothetical protein
VAEALYPWVNGRVGVGQRIIAVTSLGVGDGAHTSLSLMTARLPDTISPRSCNLGMVACQLRDLWYPAALIGTSVNHYIAFAFRE